MFGYSLAALGQLFFVLESSENSVYCSKCWETFWLKAGKKDSSIPPFLNLEFRSG
jgi:hypothetical protein